jgi:nucleotide-binding universal stress UspA family protein
MRILVPVDGSEPALDAVHHAIRLHREGLKADFLLVTVQEPTNVYEMVLAPDAEVLEKTAGAVGGRALEGAEGLFKRAGVAFELVPRSGCDAIIMGARGLGMVRSALLGSVSQAVLYGAKVPVTIVKHAARGTND